MELQVAGTGRLSLTLPLSATGSTKLQVEPAVGTTGSTQHELLNMNFELTVTAPGRGGKKILLVALEVA